MYYDMFEIIDDHDRKVVDNYFSQTSLADRLGIKGKMCRKCGRNGFITDFL